MVYYYIPNPNDEDYQNKNNRDLKDKWEDEITKYLPKIKNKFPHLTIRLLWTSKSTFGWVFSDFVKDYKGRTIGKGERDLYRKLVENYDLILLSNKIGDWFSEPHEIDNLQILRLNIVRFRKVLSNFGRTSDVVDLFLKETLPDEKTLREWKARIEEFKEIEPSFNVDKVLRFLQNYPSDRLDEIQEIVDFLLDNPHYIKMKTERAQKLLKLVESVPKDIILKPQTFSRTVDLLSQVSPETEFSDDDVSKLIGMLHRFSEIFKIKNRKDLEKVIDSMINFLVENNISEPTDFNRFYDAVVRISTHYNITNPDDLKKILELCKISDSVIRANRDYFYEILAEFEKMISNPNTLEKELQDFVTIHRWLIDFKFWSYDIVEKEKALKDIGRIDLYMEKQHIKTRDIAVVEFKKADITPTDPRVRKDKPVLTKGIVSALNQVMHYIENLPRESYDHVEGWVIAGREKTESDYFVKVFDKYVHGIKTVTFTELHKRAKQIVDAFSNPTDFINPP